MKKTNEEMTKEIIKNYNDLLSFQKVKLNAFEEYVKNQVFEEITEYNHNLEALSIVETPRWDFCLDRSGVKYLAGEFLYEIEYIYDNISEEYGADCVVFNISDIVISTIEETTDKILRDICNNKALLDTLNKDELDYLDTIRNKYC
jgi:hypothetical protein